MQWNKHYLHQILLQGIRPFLYRSRLRNLLGVPMGIKLSGISVPPVVSFHYLLHKRYMPIQLPTVNWFETQQSSKKRLATGIIPIMEQDHRLSSEVGKSKFAKEIGEQIDLNEVPLFTPDKVVSSTQDSPQGNSLETKTPNILPDNEVALTAKELNKAALFVSDKTALRVYTQSILQGNHLQTHVLSQDEPSSALQLEKATLTAKVSLFIPDETVSKLEAISNNQDKPGGVPQLEGTALSTSKLGEISSPILNEAISEVNIQNLLQGNQLKTDISPKQTLPTTEGSDEAFSEETILNNKYLLQAESLETSILSSDQNEPSHVPQLKQTTFSTTQESNKSPFVSELDAQQSSPQKSYLEASILLKESNKTPLITSDGIILRTDVQGSLQEKHLKVDILSDNQSKFHSASQPEKEALLAADDQIQRDLLETNTLPNSQNKSSYVPQLKQPLSTTEESDSEETATNAQILLPDDQGESSSVSQLKQADLFIKNLSRGADTLPGNQNKSFNVSRLEKAMLEISPLVGTNVLSDVQNKPLKQTTFSTTQESDISPFVSEIDAQQNLPQENYLETGVLLNEQSEPDYVLETALKESNKIPLITSNRIISEANIQSPLQEKYLKIDTLPNSQNKLHNISQLEKEALLAEVHLRMQENQVNVLPGDRSKSSDVSQREQTILTAKGSNETFEAIASTLQTNHLKKQDRHSDILLETINLAAQLNEADQSLLESQSAKMFPAQKSYLFSLISSRPQQHITKKLEPEMTLSLQSSLSKQPVQPQSFEVPPTDTPAAHPPVVVIKKAQRPQTTLPRAFWERSYLSRIHLHYLR